MIAIQHVESTQIEYLLLKAGISMGCVENR